MFWGTMKHIDRRLRRFSFRLYFTLDALSRSFLSLWKWQPLCHPMALYRRLLSLIYQLIDLCHRKQKKMTGQFKGLVRATKRGAANVRQKKGKRWHKILTTPWAVKCLWGWWVIGRIIERDTFGKYPFYSLCSWRTILEISPKLPIYWWF